MVSAAGLRTWTSQTPVKTRNSLAKISPSPHQSLPFGEQIAYNMPGPSLTTHNLFVNLRTSLKTSTINGTTIFIWGAVDLDDEKVIAVWVSLGRSGLEAKAFLKKVRSTCKGRLPRIFVDGGTWYPWALGQAGFQKCTVYLLDPEALLSDYSAILNGE